MDSIRYVFSSKCTYSWFIGMFLHNSKLGSITLFGPLHSVPNFCLFRLLAKPRQAMSVYTPVKHRPEWYWKEVFERRGIEAPGSSGYEDGSGVVVGGRKPTGQKNPKDTWKVANLKLFLQMCFFTSLHTSDVYMYNMYIHLICTVVMYNTKQHVVGHFMATLPSADIPQDAWLDILFSHAQNEVLGCQVHSGRYWAPHAAFEKKRLFFFLEEWVKF